MQKSRSFLRIVGLLLFVIVVGGLLKANAAPSANEVIELPAGWGKDVAAGQLIIARQGGVTYAAWGNANDAADYNTPTNQPRGGRWANSTNQGDGAAAVVDLGAAYPLVGVGYRLDWDGAFQNPLTVLVEVSTDKDTWTPVSRVVHPYAVPHVSNLVNVNLAIDSGPVRYVRFSEPPDGAWNGWGDFYQLRAYVAADD